MVRGTDRLIMDIWTLELTRCCKRQLNDSCELMSHSSKLLRGYCGQMRCCDRLMTGSCGKVTAGACKQPSGWRPKSSVKFGDGGTHGTHRVSVVQRSLLKIIFVHEAQMSKNGIVPDLFALTLVNFRHISIVKLL